jgi:hypothetical protein
MLTMLVIFASLAAGTAASAGSALPISYDYPWCVYGGELGYSGDCSYETREQCLASASGADSGDCGQGFRLNATMRSDRMRPPVPTKAAGVSLPA